MKLKRKSNLLKMGCFSLLFTYILSTTHLTAFAETIEERVARQQAMSVASNEIENWPTGPIVSAESAILIEANTGAILYEKNIHTKQYPASTTKILTALIASELCSYSDIVTFSHSAVFDTPRDSNHIAIDVGEELTIEDSLKAILIRSANEVSFAVAEHISGTWQDFGSLMNQRAKELGCLNSNFVNPNGLPDDNHYTTAYDLAMIGKAFFANDSLCAMSISPMLYISPSEKQPDDIVESSSNQMLPGRNYAYEYLVGAKTGYTNDARSSYVACAEKNGMKLICVVLRDESPSQYQDTIALFEYGFNNFSKINVANYESTYQIDSTGLFYSENDVFGSSTPLLTLNKDAYIVLPNTIDFEDADSTISYETTSENQAALIKYSYKGITLGSASVDLNLFVDEEYQFSTNILPNEITGVDETSTLEKNTPETNFIFINIWKLLFLILLLIMIILLIIYSIYFFKNTHFSNETSRIYWFLNRKRNRKRHINAPPPSAMMKRKQQIAEAKSRQRKRRNK